MTTDKKTVAVAISGGVDSSVAAALLLEKGYAVVGVTMLHWDYSVTGGADAGHSLCPSEQAVNDAAAVCEKLAIPHHVFEIKTPFRDLVIQNFIDEYLVGRTPNPCVFCNRVIKWGALMDKALALGVDYFATGHYVKIAHNPATGRYGVRCGADARKDQSYALWQLTQAQLQQTLFPLGDLTKAEVRQKAAELELVVAHKSESQEICFIADDDYERFLKEMVPDLAEKLQGGEVIDETGRVLGEHRGYPFYTIGQRKGLRVSAGKRTFVNRIDPENNRIYVGPKEMVLAHGLIADSANWSAIVRTDAVLPVQVKIRYNDSGSPATLRAVLDDQIEVVFENPQNSVTPGQSVVCYQNDIVIAGGIITAAL